jgi:hypothetical protein
LGEKALTSFKTHYALEHCLMASALFS